MYLPVAGVWWVVPPLRHLLFPPPLQRLPPPLPLPPFLLQFHSLHQLQPSRCSQLRELQPWLRHQLQFPLVQLHQQ
ncbi:hypothetical protein OAO87_00085 [bacterium]|nr:hypothetical protein [bacterium]